MILRHVNFNYGGENGYERLLYSREQADPTKFWINNVTINQAELALHAGAVGCTQNPAYTWKILNSADKDAAVQILDEILKTEEDDNKALIKLQRALVERVAERFMPLYEASNGKYGYVSIQGDPFDESEESIIDCARFNRANYPNIMAKIPATVSGLRAIRVLLREGKCQVIYAKKL